MVAHEAVHNHRSRTSLLSEGEMRNCGLIVDSTSKHHRGIDGLPRTQSIYAPDKSVQFPMIQRDALMVLPHRYPTDAEVKTLPKFILTDETPWIPTYLHDDDDTTSLLDQDVTVPVPWMDTQAFQLTNLHRYVDPMDDDSTIASDDLPDCPASVFLFLTNGYPVCFLVAPCTHPNR
jgi:hypothetical protein